jgi:enoyl-CoA hydratase/carnithine racemase
LRLWGSRLTTIAVINGKAQREGLILAMGCDYRIGTADNLDLKLNYTAMGLIPGCDYGLLNCKLSLDQIARLDFPEGLTSGLDLIQAGILHEVNTQDAMTRAMQVMQQLLTRSDNAVANQKFEMFGSAIEQYQQLRVGDARETVARISKSDTQNCLADHLRKQI